MTSRLRHLFSGKFPLATVVDRRVVATPRVGYPDDMTLDKHVLKIGWFANYELHRISAIPPDSYLALLSAAFVLSDSEVVIVLVCLSFINFTRCRPRRHVSSSKREDGILFHMFLTPCCDSH